MIELIYQHRLIATLSISTLIISFKYLLVTLIRSRAKKKRQDKRYLVSNVKNLLNFILIVLLLSIWINEIQNFALSIAAFAVAIVLATREFIQCIIGFFYLMSSRPFRIGDWIQVDGFAGEVSATDWIKTTLLEVDISRYEYTGKTLFLPNNKLINSPIKNLNFLKRYVTHHFSITRDEDVNPYLIIEKLRQTAKEHCADFYDVATRYNQIIERRLDVKISGPEPHIEVTTSEIGHTVIKCTIFCPTERAIEIEQSIMAAFMELWFTEFNKPSRVD
ncbi:mechanosensitive ion channel family protein [Aliiglaciecola sp. M165]|uniref:mechanosensitive ion channel family protein n=1 Tax=Aliiglaciecola sp. M165 TaxID=2593649 RepID=UPI00117D8040|nr:mechanosensitive ion channel family protein [Aliiglaciecola sp. M165]TRY33026.1 mechanosensitive ion channel family protein [Aliiglaciecola sp. M165]